jgi:hypothetical protein
MVEEPTRWEPGVEEVLSKAGWRPDRQIGIDDWTGRLSAEGWHLHEAARRFLAEFGGLRIPAGGAGRRVVRVSLELEPTLCSGQRYRFEQLCPEAGDTLYPIGEAGGGNASLGIDGAGTLFMLMDDECRRVGVGDGGLASLILGDY